jgi:hypothetical protein
MSKTSSTSGLSSELPLLNKQIQTHLVDRKISSFKFCSQLGIPHAQFAEAIKRTNFFPRDPRLFEMLNALQIENDGFTDESSYEKLQRRYAVTFKRRYASKGREEYGNIADLLQSYQELPPSVYKTIKEFSIEVEHGFSLLKKDDIFVYTSLNLLPFEMTPGGLVGCAKHIAKAAASGALLLYLFPQKKLQDKYLTYGCAMESYNFEELFRNVFLPALKEQLSDPSEIARIESNVLMLVIEDNPFFAVDHKFALYKVWRQVPQVVETYCLGLLPFGKPDNAYILPLNQEFTGKFSEFITWRLKKAAQGQDNTAADFYKGALDAFRKS